MTMPLVPPVSEATAEVPEPDVKTLFTSKDMMQPEPPPGQFMGEAVTGLPATLKKIRSLLVVVLLNSVIGEQPATAVVSVGPKVGVPMTPALIGIPHNALVAPFVLHAYNSPVPFAEL